MTKYLVSAVTALFATAAAFNPTTGVRHSTIELHARSVVPDDDLGGCGGPPHDACTRRDAVATVLSGSAAALGLGLAVAGLPAPAVAGLGAIPPFETARAQYYPGALRHSVASLRTVSALRWINTSEKRRRVDLRHVNPKRTVVGGVTCPDDSTAFGDSLAAVIGKEYAGSVALRGGPGGAPLDLKADLAAIAAKLPEDVAEATGARGNAVIVFGPHVGISAEGRLGYVEYERDQPPAVSEYVAAAASSAGGEDEAKAIIAATKQAYKTILGKVQGQIAAAGEELWESGVSDLTILGGITINRAKFGKDKDKGEDWFYPLTAITYLPDGTTTDKFEGAFGDMGIPDKDRK